MIQFVEKMEPIIVNLKMFLEKFIHNFFWRSIVNFDFWGFGSSCWNVKNFHFLKYKEFFGGFRFWKYKKFFQGFSFLKYKIFFNIRVQEIFLEQIFLFFKLGLKRTKFYFWKYKKSFHLRKYKIFLNIRAKKLRNFFQGEFFYFSSLGWKVRQVAV